MRIRTLVLGLAMAIGLTSLTLVASPAEAKAAKGKVCVAYGARFSSASCSRSTATVKVAENLAAGTLVAHIGKKGLSGKATITLVKGGRDNAAFRLTKGVLRTARSLDYERQSTYRLKVQVKVKRTKLVRSLVVRVLNRPEPKPTPNRAPSAPRLSPSTVLENQPVGTAVGTLSATDPDRDPVHFSLTGTDFTLDGTTVRTARGFDHETEPTVPLTVSALDNHGHATAAALTVTIGDIADERTVELSADSLEENEPVGTAVGTLTLVDAGHPEDGPIPGVTWSLVAGPGADDNAAVSLSGDELRTASVWDFEAATTQRIRLRGTTTGGDSVEQALTLHVIDVNEAPTGLTLSQATIAENLPAGTTVGTLVGTDPDASGIDHYGITGGAGANSFTVVGDQLRSTISFDFESASSYPLQITAYDAGGLAVTTGFTITVVDVNEAPTALALSPRIIAENSPAATVIGTLTATDPDGDALTWSTTSAQVAIVDGNKLVSTGAYDYETTPAFTVSVTATDDGQPQLSGTAVFTITVTDQNEPPTTVTLTPSTVTENKPAGTVVGTFQTSDPDGGTFTYTVPSGGPFAVSGTQLVTTTPLDFEAKSTYSVTVTVTDGGGLTKAVPLTVTVLDANDAPVAVADSYGGVLGNTTAVLGTTASPAVTLTGALPIANDTDQDGDTLSAVPSTVTSTLGGSATIAANGSFSYRPPAGARSTTDAFSYTVTDGTATATGTVSLAIGLPTWWVKTGSGTGTGTSWDPYTALTSLNSSATDPDQPGDRIFVHAGSYAGPLTLEANQTLVGEGAGISGVVAAGTAPSITGAAGTVLTMAEGTQVSGLTVAPSGTATGVAVPAGSSSVSVGAAITSTATGGSALSVTGRTAGAVTVSGAITGSGGISLTGNTGATLDLNGPIDVATTTRAGFTATGGGTLAVTGTPARVVTTTGQAISIANVTAAAGNISFTSVSATGAATAVAVSNTGTTGLFKISPTSASGCGGDVTGGVGGGSTIPPVSSLCSGGTIASTTGDSVTLTSTKASISGLRITGSGGNAIRATNVTGLDLADSLLQSNGNGAGEGGLLVGSSDNPGSGATGTVALTRTTIADSFDDGAVITSGTGALTVAVTGSQITQSSTTAGGSRDGLRVLSSQPSTITVTGNLLQGARGDNLQITTQSASSTATVTNNKVTGSSAGRGLLVSATGSPYVLGYTISGNAISGVTGRSLLVSTTDGGTGTVATGTISANTLGGACPTNQDGIRVVHDSAAGVHAVSITGNNLTGCGTGTAAITTLAGSTGALNATIANNQGGS